MLEEFFRPQSIAVVGASREPGKVGHDVLNNLAQYGFEGALYPVNPKADQVLGRTCYASVKELPAAVDLAVIVVPARVVLPVMEECGQKGVRAAIIISAGFKESGVEGAERERAMTAIAARYGIRVIGPNCLGLINTQCRLNASFAADMPARGNIAFVSQSGAFGTAVLDWAIGERIGFSKFVSVGNKADVDEVDLLRAIGQDQETAVILGYVESVANGAEFVRVAREVSRIKPLVIMKSGGTQAGARAASSHTGALAGSENAFRAAFRQSGILRVSVVEEMFDLAMAFSFQGRIAGPRIAIVTNAGGPGIIATDAIERSGLRMADLSRETVETLRPALPAAANLYNPIDVLGDAPAERYRVALAAAIADPNVDGMIVIVTPQTTTEPEATAEAVAELASGTDKPILGCLMGGPRVAEGRRILVARHVPDYPFPERAVRALEAMYRYRLWLDQPEETPPRVDARKKVAHAALATARAEERMELDEHAAREVIGAYGFRLPTSRLAATAAEAVAFAADTGGRVVLKIASPDILHKSDVGGVKVGLQGEEAVREAYHEIRDNARRRMPQAEIRGVLVQEMVAGGKEVILGMTRDPQFGPLLMFGLGGIYVEVLKDVSFRLAPLTRRDAEEMVREIRSYPLLRGVRGEPPADVGAIIQGLLQLSQLVMDFPEVVEMDVNPLVVFPQGHGAVALDARLALAFD